MNVILRFNMKEYLDYLNKKNNSSNVRIDNLPVSEDSYNDSYVKEIGGIS